MFDGPTKGCLNVRWQQAYRHVVGELFVISTRALGVLPPIWTGVRWALFGEDDVATVWQGCFWMEVPNVLAEIIDPDGPNPPAPLEVHTGSDWQGSFQVTKGKSTPLGNSLYQRLCNSFHFKIPKGCELE